MADDANNTHLRTAPRFGATCKGSIFYEDKLHKALVQDLSDTGMLLMCNRDFEPGTIIGVHLELSVGVSVDCEVEVCNRTDLGLGVKIDYMDDQNRRLYQAFLQEYFSTQLNRLG